MSLERTGFPACCLPPFPPEFTKTARCLLFPPAARAEYLPPAAVCPLSTFHHPITVPHSDTPLGYHLSYQCQEYSHLPRGYKLLLGRVES